MPRHGEERPTYRDRELEKYCEKCRSWQRININYQSKRHCPKCNTNI